MKTLTFAAGLAAGYLLGTRAGREKYQQIVHSAKNLSEHPTVQQAQTKLKNVLGAAQDTSNGHEDRTDTEGATIGMTPDRMSSSSATQVGYPNAG